MSSKGKEKLRAFTANRIGKYVAVVLENQVISAPMIREEIAGGVLIISGNFTEEEAKQIAILLNIGELPFPILVVDHNLK